MFSPHEKKISSCIFRISGAVIVLIDLYPNQYLPEAFLNELGRLLLSIEPALLLVAPHVGLEEDEDAPHSFIAAVARDTSPPRLSTGVPYNMELKKGKTT